MKIKSIVLVLVMFLTLVGISCVCADTVHFVNSSFEIPDGYTIIDNDTSQLIIYNDTTVLTMYEGPIVDPVEAKENRVAMGYTLIGEADYYAGKVKINQQNYQDDGIITCVYTFTKNGKDYIITLNVDEDDPVPEYEDNPVTRIIYTLK